MSRFVPLCLALSLVISASVLPTMALGQSQDSQSESVAEAARRAREQKKDKAAVKPAQVVTEDTLKPALPSAQAAENSSNTPAGQPVPASTPEDEQQRAKSSAELDGLKRQVAEAQKALDLVKREFALQQDTFYSNPDHDRDTAGKAKLDDMKQQIEDKQQEVDGLKARLAELQESPAAAPPPAAPPQL